jgi:SAM-dependent methyltransferase
MLYEPTRYWEDRLTRYFHLGGVGNIGFSERYNQWLYKRKRRCLESALQSIDLQDKRVLDVGCGTGFFVKWYLTRGCNVTGIDITDISINRLQEMLPGEYYRRDITTADYPSAISKFDIINVWDVLYHVVDDEAHHRALKNIAADLAVGGFLLITDFLGAAVNTSRAPHVRGRCLHTYEAMLVKRGIQLVALRPLYKFLNKSHFGRFDNYLGSLCYIADSFARKPQRDALCLGIWKKTQMTNTTTYSPSAAKEGSFPGSPTKTAFHGFSATKR